MTREEAAKILYNEWQGFLEDNLDYAGISDAYKMGINALKQQSTLDKIRAEIQGLRNCSCSCSDGIIDDVEDIIDKYRAESEVEE